MVVVVVVGGGAFGERERDVERRERERWVGAFRSVVESSAGVEDYFYYCLGSSGKLGCKTLLLLSLLLKQSRGGMVVVVVVDGQIHRRVYTRCMCVIKDCKFEREKKKQKRKRKRKKKHLKGIPMKQIQSTSKSRLGVSSIQFDRLSIPIPIPIPTLAPHFQQFQISILLIAHLINPPFPQTDRTVSVNQP